MSKRTFQNHQKREEKKQNGFRERMLLPNGRKVLARRRQREERNYLYPRKLKHKK